MAVQQFGEQGLELALFRGVEAGQEFGLDGIGVLHSAGVAAQIPRLAALLATPPVPPTLFEPVPQSAPTEAVGSLR